MTPTGARRRAAFLDRDGAICEEMGYLNHISRLRMFPFAAAAVKRLNDAGIPVVIVTNQSGVARGFFPEELVQRIHEKMKQELAAAGARVDAIYYCPHQKDEACQCRKPLPGMLQRSARDHSLELAGSFVISDRYADIEMAHVAGCRSVLVMTGYGRGEYEWNRARWPRQPDFLAEDLTEAVSIILREMPKSA